MSEWRGLHNPERHNQRHRADPHYAAICETCEGSCFAERPCRCCLEAEVERLTGERDAARFTIHQIRGVLRLYAEVPREVWSQTDALGAIGEALWGEL